MNHPEDWTERTKIVASMIEPNSYVVDFGAGERRLANYLPAGCLYTPFDIESKEDQFRFDVEGDNWSVVPGNYDVAVISGLLEWLDYPVDFLSKITAPTVILSYAVVDNNSDLEARKAAGWKNNFTLRELLDIMDALGYIHYGYQLWNEQVVAKFVRRND